MKALKLMIFSVLIAFAPVQKSQAAVAGVMAIAGSPAAGGVALAGLGSAGVGYLATISASSCDGGTCVVGLFLGLVVGVVLLDEESGSIEFDQISSDLAKKLELSKLDMEVYNSEIEEANMIFSEVQSQLTGESSVEESQELWSEYSDFLSPETFKVMKKLASQK